MPVQSESFANTFRNNTDPMGGRIASLIAEEVGVDGLICLGYPFHPSENRPIAGFSIFRPSRHRR